MAQLNKRTLSVSISVGVTLKKTLSQTWCHVWMWMLVVCWLYWKASALIHLALFCSPFSQLNLVSHDVRPSLTEYVIYINFSCCSVYCKMSAVNVSEWPAVLCSFTRGLEGDVKYVIQAALLILTQNRFKIIPSFFPYVRMKIKQNQCAVYPLVYRTKDRVLTGTRSSFFSCQIQ